MPTVIWIMLGAVVLAACLGSGKGKNTKRQDNPVRIDRMHMFEADDHECSRCGARFKGKGMVCPKCGARFTATKDEDDEFIEEMEYAGCYSSYVIDEQSEFEE